MVLQPRRFAAAVLCTAAALVASALAWRLGPAGTSPTLKAMAGALVAFNLLLFFPPGSLATSPARVGAALLANLVPLPLAVMLFNLSQPLADAAVIAAAGIAVLARPLGAPRNALAILVALNLLIPLLLGAAPALVPLLAVASLIGTACAVAADLLMRRLHDVAPDFERRLLRRELAGFFDDLERAWRRGSAWPDPALSSRIARIRQVREDWTVATPGPAVLPAEAMLEGVGRTAASLRAKGMTPEDQAAVDTALVALHDAMRMDDAPGARRAVGALHDAALRADPARQPAAADALGLALLLGDLLDVAMA